MKNLNKILSKVLVASLSAGYLMFGLFGPLPAAAAATAPSLGAAASYSVFGKAGVDNTGAPTHVWGNVGADATNVTGLGAGQVDGVIDSGAGVEAAILTAYGDLDAQGADGGQTLSGTVTIPPGVWTVGAALINGTVTLSGAGVYILRSSSNITVEAGAQVVLANGAAACNVFWQVPDAMTIGVGAHVEGTIIASTQLVSLATNATLVGRAFSRIAQVTLQSNQITEPTCVGAAATPTGSNNNNLIVVKQVINDGGDTAQYSDFQLFVNGSAIDSGEARSLPAGTYTVTEQTVNNNYINKYTTSFAGDCDAQGRVALGGSGTYHKTCFIINNDKKTIAAVLAPVPPLIEIVKVPSPLALPGGPGAVAYTYTLRNIGTVPVENIKLIGDTCSPIVLLSGDSNNDAKLDVNETWAHTCSTTLSATHTNTVVATGSANGIMATDIASATVVVGIPLVPPLIHVVKIPTPLTLPYGGGAVTYAYTVTNPGTVPLSNVSITDDKCTGLPGRVLGHPGDLNSNDLLESNEAWSFTCQTSLVQTTTNIGTAVGSANGLVATDFAPATVVVSALAVIPELPRSGIGPVEAGRASWLFIIASGISVVLFGAYLARKKQII